MKENMLIQAAWLSKVEQTMISMEPVGWGWGLDLLGFDLIRGNSLG
jgi:hypothetical protein